MIDVIIACAGGYGLEVYEEICNINKELQILGKEIAYNFLGFLSDVPVDLESQGIHERILGTISDWQPSRNEYFMIGLSRPEQKKKVSGILLNKGAQFTNVVSPYAHVAANLNAGYGCFISGGAFISRSCRLGNFVNINGSMLYAGASVGDYSTTTGFTIVENACVGEGVFIGSKAVITAGCSVGDWSQVYVGSVVMNDVKPGSKVFGMPAAEIG